MLQAPDSNVCLESLRERLVASSRITSPDPAADRCIRQRGSPPGRAPLLRAAHGLGSCSQTWTYFRMVLESRRLHSICPISIAFTSPSSADSFRSVFFRAPGDSADGIQKALLVEARRLELGELGTDRESGTGRRPKCTAPRRAERDLQGSRRRGFNRPNSAISSCGEKSVATGGLGITVESCHGVSTPTDPPGPRPWLRRHRDRLRIAGLRLSWSLGGECTRARTRASRHC